MIFRDQKTIENDAQIFNCLDLLDGVILQGVTVLGLREKHNFLT